MNEPIPLHRYPVPDPHWLASIPRTVAADAVSYLLSAASDTLDWMDDQDAESVKLIIDLASELLDTITEDAEQRPQVSFPAWQTPQAASYITDAADRFELCKTYDVCADQYNPAAVVLVDAMRETARDLLHASRTA